VPLVTDTSWFIRGTSLRAVATTCLPPVFLDCYLQDIAICQETGDRYGESAALNNLGVTYGQLRRKKQGGGQGCPTARRCVPRITMRYRSRPAR
jgi:hypothetical protein